MLGLPETIEEQREVVVVVQGLQGHLAPATYSCLLVRQSAKSNLPADPVAPAVVLEGDGEVPAVIRLPATGVLARLLGVFDWPH